MAFPISPVEGQTYVNKQGITYVYQNGAWVLLTTGSSVAKVPLSYLVVFTGNAVDISLGTAVPFTSPQIVGSDITMPSPGSFVLKAGGRYRLEGMIKMLSGQSFAGFRWGTAPGRPVGTYGGSGSGNTIDANVTDGAAIAIVEPLVDTTYSLFLTGESGTVPLYFGNENLMGTYAVITQIDAATSLAVTSFSGATAIAAGKVGLVPAPAAGQQLAYLRGDGQFYRKHYALIRTDNNQNLQTVLEGGRNIFALSAAEFSVKVDPFLLRVGNSIVIKQAGVYRLEYGVSHETVNNPAENTKVIFLNGTPVLTQVAFGAREGKASAVDYRTLAVNDVLFFGTGAAVTTPNIDDVYVEISQVE